MELSRSGETSFADLEENKKMNAIELLESPKSTGPWRRTDITKTSNPGESTDSLSIQIAYRFIEDRVYLLSAFIGDMKKPNNKYKGVLGVTLWTFNLACHFALDFYEARFVFHVSWATIIVLYLINFIVCSVFIIRHTVPWYIKTVKKLSMDPTYATTIQRLHFTFKYLPMAMCCLAISGAGAQFGCYAYDGALRLSFGTSEILSANRTVIGNQSKVPSEVEVLFNVIRFTSLVHIYYAMFYFLIMNAIVFFTMAHSQKSFNGHMGDELKHHPPTITFQEAVNRFSARTKLLRGASSSTTNVLSTLLLTTSISFVVNAYNFLFIQRFAIYIWFAVAPLLWLVVPLIGAALVTSQYQKYKLIVIQAWVEIPEKYDDAWHHRHWKPDTLRDQTWEERSESSQRVVSERTELAGKIANCETNNTLNTPDSEPPTKRPASLHMDKVQEDSNFGNNSEKDLPGTPNASIKCIDFNGAGQESPGSAEANPIRASMPSRSRGKEPKSCADADSFDGTVRSRALAPLKLERTGHHAVVAGYDTPYVRKRLQCYSPRTAKQGESSSGDTTVNSSATIVRDKNDNVDFERGEITQNTKLSKNLSNVVNVARSVGYFKTVHRKFNYEKYIKFLELTIDTVGFSLGKVTITWDRVSFFMVLLLTSVGVFAQNAFLKGG